MAKSEPNLNVNSISRISAGTVIKGEIMSPYDIRIDGTFDGKVQSKGRVVIGETASVKGDIICENIDLWGKVEGNIYVKDTLSLMEGCSVNGNLNIRRLAVELGSTFNGNCRMMNEGEFDKLSGNEKKPAVAAAPGVHAAPAQPHAAPAN
jgi:cytoskeletal protein CcmA (bactofilin family)